MHRSYQEISVDCDTLICLEVFHLWRDCPQLNLVMIPFSSFIPSMIVQDHNPLDDEVCCARNKSNLLVFFNSWLYIYIHVVISDEFAISSMLIMHGVSKTQLIELEKKKNRLAMSVSLLSFPTQQLHRRRGRRP